jgi:hypothetical protein
MFKDISMHYGRLILESANLSKRYFVKCVQKKMLPYYYRIKIDNSYADVGVRRGQAPW